MKGLILGLLLAFGFASAQDTLCAPGAVTDISLDADFTLSWSAPANPNNCTINYYVINIIDSEDGSEFQLQVPGTDLSYSVSFLAMCKTYTFEVQALTSENLLGPAAQFSGTTPPRSNPNLNLAGLQANATGTVINLAWEMVDPDVSRCVSYFRVVYWDESNVPRDSYVRDTNYTLENVIPCMSYNFQVQGMITSPDIPGDLHLTSAVGVPAVAQPPTLVGITTTTSSAVIEYRLQPFSENRCLVRAMVVYTLGAPKEISAFQLPVTDNVLRPNMNISLTSLPAFSVYFNYVNIVNEVDASRTIFAAFATINE